MTVKWQAAYITGAGSGIGLALAEALAARGSRVAAFDLLFTDEARDRLRRASPATEFFAADVRDGPALEAAVRAAVGKIGAPDVAINSAGVQVARTFDQLSQERFDFVIDVNLRGSRNFAAAVLPHLGRDGRLCFIASLAGLVGNYGYAAYNASKFGVIGLASALRIECKPKGIFVTVVCPPEVETPMVFEERRTAPAVTTQAKQFAGSVTLEELCGEVLRGLEHGQWMIVPGGRAKLTAWLARWMPGLMRRVTDRMIAQGLRG
jgi:NAD(P)-dependent dehydrogenase (short-subunit alcohol dehydrogenase family)